MKEFLNILLGIAFVCMLGMACSVLLAHLEDLFVFTAVLAVSSIIAKFTLAYATSD
jgi:hypothetical protein